MIIIYWIFGYILLPFLPLLLIIQSKKNKNFLSNLSERFMLKNLDFIDVTKDIIWIHSVSVGETRSIQKIIELLNKNYPKYKILITTMTPTGRKTAQDLYPNCMIKYVPYDVLHIVNKFIKLYQPKIFIIIETEIWPTIIYLCHKKNIPIFLINARLSNKSICTYNRLKFFIKPILNKIDFILCQDSIAKINFDSLLDDNKKTLITGNTKFDLLGVNIKHEFEELKLQINKRKVVIFASSRDGEEKYFLEKIDLFENDILFIIVPRHPNRFIIVENLLKYYAIKYQKRSTIDFINQDTKVLLGDSMGEMLNYFYLSSITIIGGSFLNYGGQNPIESIFLNKPVLFGKYMYNFLDISNNILKYNCGMRVDNHVECIDMINKLLSDNDRYNIISKNCNTFISNYIGASRKNFEVIKTLL